MTPPTVTLVMPNYNHAAYLERALSAIFGQTAACDELIIVDDASTDGSVATIERMISGRKGVELIRNSVRAGAIAALNMGLSRARGDFIAFPSADDLLFPQFLERLRELLGRHPPAAFACACVEVRDGGDRITGHRPILWPAITSRYIPAAEASRQLARGDNFFLGATTLYRRRMLQDAGGFDPTLSSLADGMLQRQLAVAHGFCFAPQMLGIWRLHDINYSITSATEPAKLERMLAAARDRIAAASQGQFPDGYAEKFDCRLRFNASRLVVLGGLPVAEQTSRISAMAHLSPRETSLLGTLLKMGAVGRTTVLAWLTLRFRPYALSWLLVEPLRRRYARIAQRFDWS